MSQTSTSINVAGLSYSIKVDENNREAVENAASFINEHISEFEKKYPVKEKRDILAMVSLEMVTELLKNQQQQASEIKSLKNAAKRTKQHGRKPCKKRSTISNASHFLYYLFRAQTK